VKGTNHSTIFSLFEDELGKSLTQTQVGYSRRQFIEEAKDPMLDFCGNSTSYE
jgi:hypothetical protein